MQKYHWFWLIGVLLILGLPFHFPLIGLGLCIWGCVEYSHARQ